MQNVKRNSKTQHQKHLMIPLKHGQNSRRNISQKMMYMDGTGEHYAK